MLKEQCLGIQQETVHVRWFVANHVYHVFLCPRSIVLLDSVCRQGQPCRRMLRIRLKSSLPVLERFDTISAALSDDAQHVLSWCWIAIGLQCCLCFSL